MRRAALLVVALAACTTEDNLGNHVFGSSRWSIGLGSTGDDRATAIAIHPNGDVIVAGLCGGPIDFGHGMVPCAGSFITRRDGYSGDEVWTRALDGVALTSVGVDAAGTIAATGLEGGDQVIAVLSSTGDLLVEQRAGVIGDAIAPAGTVAADGCVFVAGGYEGAITTSLGSIESAGVDGFLSSHFPTGAASWSTAFVGEGNQLGVDVAFTPDAGLAVLIDAASSFSVGDTRVDVDEPASLLAHFDLAGTLQWTRPLGSFGSLRRLGVTSTGDVVAAGETLRVVDRSGIERWAADGLDLAALSIAPNDTIVAGGRQLDADNDELVLAAYTADGELLGMLRTTPAPSAIASRIESVATDQRGVVAFVATVSRPFDFGNGMLRTAGLRDIAIVKLRSPRGADDPIVLTRPH